MPLKARLAVAPEVELYASAVPSATFQRSDDRYAHLANVITDADGNPVLSRRDIGLLTPRELNDVASEAGSALNVICPTYATHSHRDWIDAYKNGSRACPAKKQALNSCFDVVVFGRKAVFMPQPGRFWGQPPSELLDSHLMLFTAMQELLNK